SKSQIMPVAEAPHGTPHDAPSHGTEKPKKREATPERRSEEFTPPNSEAIARQMKAEGKPDLAPPPPQSLEMAKSEPLAHALAAEAPKPAMTEPSHGPETKPAAEAAPHEATPEASKQESAAPAAEAP